MSGSHRSSRTPSGRWTIPRAGITEHDPEKWAPVFRQDHARSKQVESRAAATRLMSGSSSTTRLRRKPSVDRAADGPTLDLDRYVPAFVTFIANKLSNSASSVYQRNFGINVTEWRIMTQPPRPGGRSR